MTLRSLVALVACSLLVPAAVAETWTWDEVDPRVLAARASALAPGADAELLFHRTWIDQSLQPRLSHRREHRIRKKVYSAAGAEAHGFVQLHRVTGTRIVDVHARTVRPDGSALPVPASQIQERVVADDGVTALSVVSFAFPSVEPGAVLDYSWTEVTGGALEIMMPLRFQEELPAREISYFLAGFPNSQVGLRVHALNAQVDMAPWKSYMRLTLADVQAEIIEPLSPPWGDRVPWVLAYYAFGELPTPESFWADRAKELSALTDSLLVDTRRMQTQAAMIRAAADSQEKLISLAAARARALLRPPAGVSSWSELSPPRKPSPEHDSTAVLVERGRGSRTDLLLVFVELARQAGADVRLGLAEDRSLASFDRSVPNAFFLPRLVACVKEGESWRAVEPTSGLLPANQLPWELEGASVLVAGPKEHEFIRTEPSDASQSLRRSRSSLSLGEDGLLWGRFEIEFTGHRAAALGRAMHEADSPVQEARRHLAALMPRGAWSEVVVEGLEDPEESLTLRARFDDPRHAQVGAQGLALSPALLSSEAEPLLPTGRRVNPVRFPYAWLDRDVYKIKLPPGMKLEGDARPVVLKAPNLAKHDLLVTTDDEGRLSIHRTFAFGLSGNLSFEASAAPLLADMFASVQSTDSAPVSLRRGRSGTGRRR